MYTYEAYRHHSLHTFVHGSLSEAIYQAAGDIENGEAWPSRILAEDGTPIWEETGPLETTDTLCKFARENGIDLSWL